MASYSTLLKDILNEVLVNEIGDASITPLKWTKVSPIKYKFLVDINDSTEVVNVDFQQIVFKIDKQFYFPPQYRDLNNVFNVGYDISGSEIQYAKTDLKTLLTIISTTVDIIKHFIKNNEQLDGLYIKGTPKEIGSEDISKKSNLYQAFIKKQLEQIPEFGFDTYRNGFIIIKKDTK